MVRADQSRYSNDMDHRTKGVAYAIFTAAFFMTLVSCGGPKNWPDSPLYDLQFPDSGNRYPQTRNEAIEAISGRYAHFDVVAYEDNSTRTAMRSFIVSYGYTDFVAEGDRLYQYNDFLFASYILNQQNVQTRFDPAAVEAIEPEPREVELEFVDGLWRMYRPETPVLLGITGDPSMALSRNPNDPNIIDADNDGKPGVTVGITIGGIISGEIYITRREIYRYYLTLQRDGRITGHVEDLSEQFVIDANMRILRQPSNNIQNADPGLNPVILVPVDSRMEGRQALLAIREDIFPPEPAFY